MTLQIHLTIAKAILLWCHVFRESLQTST